MEKIATNIELLFEKVKTFAEINLELIKLNAVDKVADVISSLLARLLVIMVVAMFLLFINITLGLYLGEVFGKDYLGFLAVSGIYLAIALLFHFRRDQVVKVPLTNVIIAKLLKTKVVNTNLKENEYGSL